MNGMLRCHDETLEESPLLRKHKTKMLPKVLSVKAEWTLLSRASHFQFLGGSFLISLEKPQFLRLSFPMLAILKIFGA